MKKTNILIISEDSYLEKSMNIIIESLNINSKVNIKRVTDLNYKDYMYIDLIIIKNSSTKNTINIMNKLKNNKYLCKTDVFVDISEKDKDDLKILIDMGIKDYIIRPYKYYELEFKIKKIIEILQRKIQLENINFNIKDFVRGEAIDCNKYRSHVHIKRIDNIIKNVPVASILKDPRGKIIQVNDIYLKFFNIKKEDIIGAFWKEITSDSYIEKIKKEDKEVLKGKKGVIFERDIAINGENRTVEIYKMPVIDENNNVTGILTMYTGITDLRKYNEKIKKIAFTDQLTLLNNRISLYSYLEKLNKKNKNSIAVILIDLDDFKKLNDTFGYYLGDKTLILVADIITETFKDTFNARLNGDQFAIVYEEFKKDLIIKKAKEILIQIREKFKVVYNISNVTASLGIFIGQVDEYDIREALVKTDIALFKAKELGGNEFQIYNEEMEIERKFNLEVERDIETAIENNEVKLYYQPQYTCSKELVGFEALFRWENEKYKNVPVIKIIKIIEKSHVFNEFGKYIIKEALIFAKKINENSQKSIVVSVNISAVQIMNSDFCLIFESLLDEIGVNPKYVGIEITETVLLENIQENIHKINILKGLGITVYLDDFGTGYSSLNYLVKLPISCIKIDRGFIQKMSEGEEYIKVVKFIIDICHSLDLPIVAEGVERLEELELLKNMNIEYIQGYLFSKPLPEKEAQKLLI